MRTAKLEARICRRISDKMFGSLEVSHSIVLDVEFEKPSELKAKAAEMRKIVEQMVKEGLDEWKDDKKTKTVTAKITA